MNDPDRFIEILDHATANDIGLLIFPTGNCVIMYRNLWDLDLLALIRERGHWVGNHSLSHPHMTRVSANELNRQLAGGAESNVFRPPFGDWNRRVLDAAQAQGMYLMMWDLDTDDWRGRTEQDVVDVVVNYAQPGYSVLMHLQHQGFSVGALDAIQAGLQERGLRLCRPAPLELRPTPVELPGNIC
jgi:peptidoglycan/xylan/chitin deacetylase (PgdA/CDA1 family)